MSKKNRCLELLNLPHNATKEDIRKQFRTLAKKFHPDKNKAENATELFQLIKEAYDYLIEDQSETNFVHLENNPSEEQKRMERIRKAKERLRIKRQEEEKKLKENYQKLTSGFQWKIFSVLGICALLTSCMLIIEPILPKHLEKQTVIEYSEPYNGLFSKEIFLIKTDKNLKIFCQQSLHEKLYFNDSIFVERSFIFHNPTNIYHRDNLEITTHKVDFSAVNIFPVYALFFAVPYFVKRKKQLSASYIFIYKFSFYIIESLFILYLLSQDRWFHLLFLGFL